MEDFSFWVFSYKTEFQEKVWNYIVATKEKWIKKKKEFALGNKETIVHKKYDGNRNF